MADPVTIPNTPEWWLNRLVQNLQDRQPRYEWLERYAHGRHDLPNGDKRYVRALEDLQEKAKTNYYGLIARAPVERMRVMGFRFGNGEGAEGKPKPEPSTTTTTPTTPSKPKPSSSKAVSGGYDQEAKMIWSQNDMDYQVQFVLELAAIYGESYILVSPPEEEGEEGENSEPVMTFESPRVCITERDPVRPTRLLAGLKMWADSVLGKIMVVLYLPDNIYQYEGPALNEIDGIIAPTITDRMLTPGAFTLKKVLANTIGVVPLAQIEWQPGCIAEAEDIKTVQDRVNLTMLDRLVISRSQAYRQRWVSGLNRPNDKRGNAHRKPPFDPGADMLWVTESVTAKFGDFEQSDITMILDAIRDDVIDMAALSKTPAQYLMGRMSNISGDTLAQAESGFVSKTKRRMVAAGWGLEKAMKLAFKYKGSAKATEVDAEVVWDDPEIRTRAENADATLKEAEVLTTAPPYVLALVMRRLGFSADDIDFAIAEREKFEVEQQAREDQMMKQQSQMMQGRPGAGAGGAKPATATGTAAKKATNTAKKTTNSGS